MLSVEQMISLHNLSSEKEKIKLQINKLFNDFRSIIIESLNITACMNNFYIFNHIMMLEIVKYLESENLLKDTGDNFFKHVINHSHYSEIFENLFFYDQIVGSIKQLLNNLIQELESPSQKPKPPEKKIKARFLIRKGNPPNIDAVFDREKIFLNSNNSSIKDDKWLGNHFIKIFNSHPYN
jgi:hypothetical protein